jgi:hypothetical protein
MTVWQIAIKKLNPAAILSHSVLSKFSSFHFMLLYSHSAQWPAVCPGAFCRGIDG